MKQTCVIVNPIAGSVTDIAELERRICSALPDALVEVSAKPGAIERMARKMASRGCATIIAAGGDGTLNEVVNGISAKRDSIVLGLLPLGTGNDFARSIAMPTALDNALSVLQSGMTRAIDLVRVKSRRDRYFINVSAGGFSGIVDEKLTPELKERWGPLAYLRGAASALKELHPYRALVSFEDEQALSLDIYNVVVANGRYVAGGTPIAPRASLTDGMLDVVLLRETSATQLALLVPQMLLGQHLENDTAVLYRQARRVGINSRPGMTFNVDGEFVGDEPVVFEALPQALRVLVPE